MYEELRADRDRIQDNIGKMKDFLAANHPCLSLWDALPILQAYIAGLVDRRPERDIPEVFLKETIPCAFEVAVNWRLIAAKDHNTGWSVSSPWV